MKSHTLHMAGFAATQSGTSIHPTESYLSHFILATIVDSLHECHCHGLLFDSLLWVGQLIPYNPAGPITIHFDWIIEASVMSLCSSHPRQL